jgi:AraC-like DNA-binding protein
MVAQGAKSILMNGRRYIYDSSRYLLVSWDLPLVGQIEEATQAKPFLGCSIVLDFEEIATLLVEMKLPRKSNCPARPWLIIGALDEELLDAFTRLVRLTQHPEQVTVIAPLILREIYYRLLRSEHSELLQQMVADNGKTIRIAAGLKWLRRNASRTIRMEELARELHMSPSTMHAWFRSVTSMSPLQFQKQLRLQEARRIMLAESIDANVAGRRVGYGSPSQFSREYGRLFGAPPMRDIENIRLHGISTTVEP